MTDPNSVSPSNAAFGEAPPPDYPAARSLKRELLDELRSGWQKGAPPRPEDLLLRWPGDPSRDEDVASLLFEDYQQRHRHDGLASEKRTPEDYEQRFPEHKDSLQSLFRQHECWRSLRGEGGTEPSGQADFRLALPAVGDELFGFRLRQELGRGAFARVYLAEQTDLADRPVVVKVSAIDGHEPQTLAQLQHTHIVPIYSKHEDPRAGLRAVCMPYFGGASLSAVLKALWADNSFPDSGRQLTAALKQVQGPRATSCEPQPAAPPPGLNELNRLDYVRAAAHLVARLAEALQHAHERGVLHRDVKPSNVLLAADGEPMLLDFNLALNQNLTQAQAAATLGGTVAYMAPEHLRALAARDPALARLVDHRADIYSLGMVLYEMLAGRSPFDQSASYSPLPVLIEAMAVERGRTVPSLRKHRADIPWGLESIARKCLAPDPLQRYQRAQDLAEDLRRLLEDRPLRHAPELSWRERAQKWTRRHPRLTVGSAVAAVVALLLAAGGSVLAATRAQLSAAQARVYEAEGGEARDQKAQFDVGHQQALCLVNTTADAHRHLAQGLEVCEKTLGLYQVLQRPDWQRQGGCRRLPPDDRRSVAEGVRELLVLLARARVRLSLERADPALRQTVATMLLPLAPAGGAGEVAWGQTALAVGAGQTVWGPKTAVLREASEAALADALALLDRAEAVEGLSPSAVLWEDRASYLEKLGETEGARAARETAQATPARDARDCYWQATGRALRGNYPEALKSLDEALRLNPRHYWSLLQRGICHEELGAYRLALKDFSMCQALWPEFAWGHFNCGRVLDQLGEKEEALAEYTAALERDPEFMYAHLNRGLIYLQLRRYALALADFDRAAALGRDDAALAAWRGMALEQLGQGEAADQAFAEARRRDPHNTQIMIAQAFAVQGRRPAAARAAFAAVLRQEPSSTQALYGLGMLAAARDRHSPKALEFFNRALEINPAFVEARCGRANVLAHLGDLEVARQDADWCVKTDPSGVTVYAAACVYALLSEKAGNAEAARLCRDYALDLLRRSFDLGYGRDRAGADADLAALRDHPDFLALLRR